MSSQSTSSSPSGSSLSNTSSLLFGFLVSALSIFAIFMTVAIAWNRLVARRRAIDAMLATNPPYHPRRLCRPTMWDVWVVPDRQPPPWVDVKPVAVQKCNCSASSQIAQTTRTVPFWRHRLSNYLPPEITYLFHPPIPDASVTSNETDIPQVELSHGSDIQISLLVCMPRHPRSKQEQGFQEIVFATTNAVYDDPDPS